MTLHIPRSHLRIVNHNGIRRFQHLVTQLLELLDKRREPQRIDRPGSRRKGRRDLVGLELGDGDTAGADRAERLAVKVMRRETRIPVG